MLKRANNHIIFTLILIPFFSCNYKDKNVEFSRIIIENFKYKEIYNKAIDSLNFFQSNKLSNYSFLNCGDWFLDSLFCINKSNTRLISCILYTNSNSLDAVSDGIQFFFGEKINNRWYFFSGANIFIPREMAKGQDIHKPLSYQQLHEIALKEIYGGYLNEKGEINDAWFKGYFDNAMMSYIKYKTKEEYNKLVIATSKAIWAEKFSPYTQESFDFKYDKITKTADLRFRLQTFDTIYNQPTLYKVIYQHKEMDYPSGACGMQWCPEINWQKQKYAHVQLHNVPENSEVKIKIQLAYFPATQSPVMGPFIFNTSEKTHKINSQ